TYGCSYPFILHFLLSKTYIAHISLPSFPTRRSSDLARLQRRRALAGAVRALRPPAGAAARARRAARDSARGLDGRARFRRRPRRSEEHTSELQSRENLVYCLLLEKKKKNRHSKRYFN